MGIKIKIGDKHKGRLGQLVDNNTGYVAQPRKKFAIQNPDLPRNRVDVKADRAANGEDYLEVKVFSTHGDGWLAAKSTVRPGCFKTAAELIYAIEVAGGAGAEHLAEAYGDELDPELCARYAKELGIEALKRIGESYDKKIIVT